MQVDETQLAATNRQHKNVINPHDGMMQNQSHSNNREERVENNSSSSAFKLLKEK